MNESFSIPIIGGDDELLQSLIADNVERKNQHQSTGNTNNRRKSTRYDVTLSVVCFPLLSSLEIDQGRKVDGIVIDINDKGVGLNLATRDVKVGDHWILAAEVENSGWRFIDFRVVRTSACGPGSSIVNAEFDGPLHRVFIDDLLLPELDSCSYQYQLPFTNSVLTSLSAIGATQRVVMDNVLVCPDCHSVPTVRHGCSICLSHDTGYSKMIHHFACANVDFIENFDRGGEIVCPKCLGRKMIIGADYEYLEGPTQCLECGHNDLEEILIGHCINCSNRFPFEKAASIEIIGYRVNRLEPLALLTTA